MIAREGDTIVERRWVGLGLALYGAASLALILILAVVVVAPRDGGGGPLGLDTQRLRALSIVDASTQTLLDAESAARGVDDTLLSTGGAAASAGTFMTELATTMRSLAASLRISILGSQPFAGPAADFDRVAAQAGLVAADLALAASSARLGAEDMAELADQLAAVRLEVRQIRGALAQPIDEGPWRILAGTVLAWLAVPALVSLWVGLRWWRQGSRPNLAGPPGPDEEAG